MTSKSEGVLILSRSDAERLLDFGGYVEVLVQGPVVQVADQVFLLAVHEPGEADQRTRVGRHQHPDQPG